MELKKREMLIHAVYSFSYLNISNSRIALFVWNHVLFLVINILTCLFGDPIVILYTSSAHL